MTLDYGVAYTTFLSFVGLSILLCIILLWTSNLADDTYNTVFKFFRNIDDVPPEDIENEVEKNLDIYNSSISLKNNSEKAIGFIQCIIVLPIALGFWFYLLYISFDEYGIHMLKNKSGFSDNITIRVVYLGFLLFLLCIIFISNFYALKVSLETDQLKSVKKMNKNDFMNSVVEDN